MADMVTDGDRSIRKIPIGGNHRSVHEHRAEAEMGSSVRLKKNKISLFFWGLLVTLACGVSGLLLSTFFEKATVTIAQKSQVILLPSHMVASESGAGSGLSYTKVLVKSVPKDFIPIQASLSGGQIAVIDPAELARVVAAQTVSGYKGEAVVFEDSSGINASVSTSVPTFGHMLVTLTTAASSSPTTLLWQIDAGVLQNALLGKKRSDFQSVIKTFGQSIAEAHLSMRPFWKVTLPSDETKLTVTVIQPRPNTNQD